MASIEMNKKLQTIFSGRKVLLTGHTGFKGSWLSLWLSQLGASVTEKLALYIGFQGPSLR
mgnify:CR=1 FL=1